MSYDMHDSARRALFGNYGWSAILCLTSAFALTASAKAATRCVNPHGTSGCFSTISAAITAAYPGDTIHVAPGTYAEDVLIGKPLALVGDDPEHTIIEAKGLSNGIYIDGLDNPGLNEIVISGFTVQDANFEGILVQNASAVTLLGNIVRHNDLNLQISMGLCPGQPAFETNEGDDCGEGIHLMGVDHSSIAENIVERNSGGILTTDETAPAHDNVITRNIVRDNAYDCGITVASHPAYVKTGTPPLAFGIYHNTISENESSHNGFGTPGGGAGVGLFAPGPGNINILNSVVHNRLIDNALPGVAIHNHVFLTFPGHPPNPDVNDNTIVGNYIAGNGPDSDLPTTVPTGISILGTTPITGLVITGNVIRDESIDVAVNSASLVNLHLNDFDGHLVGVDNLNSGGIVNATENWWGCAKGPGVSGCSTITGTGVAFTPWLTHPFSNEQ